MTLDVKDSVNADLITPRTLISEKKKKISSGECDFVQLLINGRVVIPFLCRRTGRRGVSLKIHNIFRGITNRRGVNINRGLHLFFWRVIDSARSRVANDCASDCLYVTNKNPTLGRKGLAFVCMC